MFDLAIVGAGPAGSAAALSALARRPDMNVALIDRSQFPRDKTCGDGVGPVGVGVLAELDALEVFDGAARIEQLRLSTAGGAVAEGSVGRHGYVLPREIFDARLVDVAVRRGAKLIHERVTSVEQRDDRVVLNGTIEAACVIGADGANSVVRRQVGAGRHPHQYQAVSIRGYAPAPDIPQRLEFRFPSDPWPAYAWAFPNADGEVNLGVVVLDGSLSMTRRQLTEAVGELLPEWEPRPETLRGFQLPLTPGRPAPAVGAVMLAGDAAGLVNPLSGEGIATALVSGMLAGDAAALHPSDAPRAYAAAMKRQLGKHFGHVDLAAKLFKDRTMIDSAVSSAGTSPKVFEQIADLTVGTGLITASVGVRIASHYLRRRVSRGKRTT